MRGAIAFKTCLAAHAPYGQDVPLIHASAGMRRIAARSPTCWYGLGESINWRRERFRVNPAREIIFWWMKSNAICTRNGSDASSLPY